jgi:hypothetical protein
VEILDIEWVTSKEMKLDAEMGTDLEHKDDPKKRTLEKKRPVVKPAGLSGLLALCLAVSTVTSIATLFCYDRWYAQKVVAVDIKGYIEAQRENYLAGKMSDDDLRKSFDRLEAVVTAIPKNRVVIMGDAVVRNAETIKP